MSSNKEKNPSSKEFKVEVSSSADIRVPPKIIDQVIGQQKGVELVHKAALQKRNVLLIGEPGTGKSLLAQGMAEIMPIGALSDILIYPNPIDPNNPKVKAVKASQGKEIVQKEALESKTLENNMRLLGILLPLGFLILSIVMWHYQVIPDVVFAATLIVFVFLLIAAGLGTKINPETKKMASKLLIDNTGKKTAPFIEATGARAGALLGDVRHDPLQSGGLGTPPHLRVEPGMIHRTNKGVLFLDEIASLSAKSQQELLTAMQEKKYSITGQSEQSSGAMVRTDPVPCDFVLVAAGNYDDLAKVHPALRSRIRGYGYEVYLNVDMPDTPENREKIVRFIAQEVVKDGKIPHFNPKAIEEIIFEARQRAQRKNRLTLKLRDLGGLIRAAGDIAKEKGHKLVEREDVLEAKSSASTLEQQMTSKAIDAIKEYGVYEKEGAVVGKVNGLAVLAESMAGLVIPIEAEVAPALSKTEGKVIATGKLGEIAREAVQNVSALIKKISGKDISGYDIHIQFLNTHSGVEGDSASISVASAVVSALESIPLKQGLAMTGSLSVRGEVLPVGGVTSKVLAAIEAGFKEIIVPYANKDDIVVPEEDSKKIKVIPVKTLTDVLDNAFVKHSKKSSLLKSLDKIIAFNLKNALTPKRVLG